MSQYLSVACGTGEDNKVFDALFYKRLKHIMSVLEEDAVELENAKNFFK